jgi:hypothetical protein
MAITSEDPVPGRDDNLVDRRLVLICKDLVKTIQIIINSVNPSYIYLLVIIYYYLMSVIFAVLAEPETTALRK